MKPVPAHLQHVRGAVLMGECDVCGDPTDLQVQAARSGGGVVWRCWLDQTPRSFRATRMCQADGCGAWFVSDLDANGDQKALRCPRCVAGWKPQAGQGRARRGQARGQKPR